MNGDLVKYFSHDHVFLRNTIETDINALVSLINEAYSYQDKARNSQRTNPIHLTKRISETDFYVVQNDDKIIGCVYLEPQGESLHFGLLTVIPEFRGTGLGTVIMNAIVELAEAGSYKYVDLDYMSVAPWLKKYYERYGFYETSEKTEWGLIDLIRMRRKTVV